MALFLKTKAIGIFDSGVGGLTVLSAIAKQLPNEHLIYLGDIARVPYGSKSSQVILTYAKQAVQFLVQQDIKLLVLACNTVSSVALAELTKLFHPLPVIGVIVASVNKAILTTKNKYIAVIGTESTINCGAYQTLIHQLLPECQIATKACPLFVAFAEEGFTTGLEIEGIARRYLLPLFSGAEKPDTLILGCTHFPMLSATIQQVLGDTVQLIDSADTTASLIYNILQMNNLLNTGISKAQKYYLVTDAPNRFINTASKFMQQDFLDAHVTWVDIV